MNRGRTRSQLTTPATALAASLIKHVHKKGGGNEGKTYTNVSLDGAYGGSFHYDEGEMKELYAAVAEAFEKKQKYYVNELNGKKRTFLLELDLHSLREKFDAEKDKEAIKRWEGEVTSELKSFVDEATDIVASYYVDKYPRTSSLFDVVVQVRLPDFDHVKSDAKEALEARGLNARLGDRVICSEGVHVFFKNLIVDEPRSLQMQAHLVERLKGLEKSNPGKIMPYSASNWDHVVDPLVYGAGKGVRFFGSSKAEACKDCKTAGNNPCATCTGVGKVDLGRVYNRVLFVMNGDRRTDDAKAEDYRNNVLKLLTDTSLRKDSSEYTEGYRVPDVAPKTHTLVRFDSRTNQDQLKGRPSSFRSASSGIFCPDPYANHSNGNKEPSGKRKRELNRTTLTDEQERVALNIIRGMSPSVYGQLEIHEVFRQESPPLLKINVKGPGCQYCHNIAYRDKDKKIRTGGRHNSHTVFFEIDPSYVRQGCNDACEPGKRNDPKAVKLRVNNNKCTTYFKNPILIMKVSAEQARLLFPGLGAPSSSSAFGGSSIFHLDYTRLIDGATLSAAKAHYSSLYASSLVKRRKVLRIDEYAKTLEPES